MNKVPNFGGGQGGQNDKVNKMKQEAEKLQQKKIQRQKEEMAQKQRAEIRVEIFTGFESGVKEKLEKCMNKKEFIGLMDIDFDYKEISKHETTTMVCTLTHLIDPKYEQEASQKSEKEA